jgi:acetoacetyl-CoA synthetase
LVENGNRRQRASERCGCAGRGGFAYCRQKACGKSIEGESGSVHQPLWRPSPARVEAGNVACFRRRLAADRDLAVDDFPALYRFSIAEPEKFWASLKDFAGLIAETWGARVLTDGDAMPGARFFPEARLNFAENLLRRRDEADAIVFWGEDEVRRRLGHAELYALVSRLRQAIRAAGIGPGDRVAAILPNIPEAVAAMLAAASLGAVWSSCSPDFGVDGVLDRFGQIEPKLLFAVDGYHYGGKRIDAGAKLRRIAVRLPTLLRTVVVAYAGADRPLDDLSGAVAWEDFVAPYAAEEIAFPRFAFDHPLYILYSSGTTGKPKCIVHGAGGTLLQHVKEHRLHCDIRAGDRVFYFTTCGWMMWNWLVTALASEATLLLYDGSPFHPRPTVLFDLADAEAMTLFGTSAKYIDALAKAGARPRTTHRLEALRTMTSTGSPLAPASFDYVYRDIKADLHLASISGGTDLISCFVLGDPTAPVWRGEIQTPGLGMAVDVFDAAGRPVRGGKGELVCTRPWPSMPVGFWNDADGVRYRAAYFERFPGVWHHGDFVEWTDHGGMIIHGRSDATLNPGGVRIGTAEIYRQVEQIDEVVEAIAVGQEWESDVRIVLFVVLRPGLVLDDGLIGRIKARIREHCSPRHVPTRVVQVADIPRTKSGKITELAVRDMIHGRPVENVEALANPEALALFRNLRELDD